MTAARVPRLRVAFFGTASRFSKLAFEQLTVTQTVVALVLPAVLGLTTHVAGLHEVAMALYVLDPLGYLGSSGGHVQIGISTSAASPIPHDIWLRIAMTWGFGILGSLTAIVGWKRLEV